MKITGRKTEFQAESLGWEIHPQTVQGCTSSTVKEGNTQNRTDTAMSEDMTMADAALPAYIATGGEFSPPCMLEGRWLEQFEKSDTCQS